MTTGERSPERRATSREAWMVAALAVWLAAGLGLVTRAISQGLVSDVAVSPYHIPVYAALGALVVGVLLIIDRGEIRGMSWRRAFPRYYDGLVLGAVAAVAWVALDLVWRTLFGIGPGLEGSLAPTRLLIPLALGFIASGPLRDALAGGGWTSSRSYRWAAIVALAVVTIAAAGALGAFDPVRHAFGARASSPPRDVSEIWLMDADGGHQTRLLPATEQGVDFSLPAWSPDGTRIAYTRWQNAPGVAANEASNQQSSAIWTMAIDGTDARVVVDGAPGNDWNPAWSPDGTWIAFTASPNGFGAGPQPEGRPLPNAPPSGGVGPPAAASRGDIWIVHPDGTGATRLTTDPGEDIAPAWAPDGTRIAFASQRTGDYEIWAMGGDGSGERQLTFDPAADQSPAWSPDGRRIAFASDRSGSWDIWVMDADGGHPVRLTSDTAQEQAPAWTPDGSRILFTSDRSGEPEVWSMAVDGSDARDLTSSPERVDGEWSASPSRDGRRIAYASAASLTAIEAPVVTEDLAVAGTLLYAGLLSVAALVLLRLGAPFGSFALLLVADVAFAAFVADQWRFLPAAALFGLVLDGVMAALRRSRLAGAGRAKPVVAAAGLPLALVLAVLTTLAVLGDLGWSPTLAIGVVIATVAVGTTVALVARGFGRAEATALVESGKA